jgi:hypothetical protein
MQASEIKPGERVKNIHLAEDTMAVDLADGRTIVVPWVWYPRLLDASSEQRLNWQVSAGGYRIHWPDIDEDLSAAGLLRGASAAIRAPTRVYRLPGGASPGCDNPSKWCVGRNGPA